MPRQTDTIANTSRSSDTRTVGTERTVSVDRLHPNPWNPNEQDDEMFQKELKSIKKFGFVVPLIVREIAWSDPPPIAVIPDFGTIETRVIADWQIIDGEHRWKAAQQLGLKEIPVWDLGLIDDDDARELTVVLNETKGQPNELKLRDLLADLLTRRPEDKVRDIMPFSRERFDELVNKQRIDWGALDERRKALGEGETRWKEFVFRMPVEAGRVVQEAIDRMMAEEQLEHNWQVIEMLAADYLAQ